VARLAVGGAIDRALGRGLRRKSAQHRHERRTVGARRLDDEEVSLVVLGDGVRVIPVAGRDVAGAGGAVEGAPWGGRRRPDLLESEDLLAQVLLGAPERDEVAVGGGRRPPAPSGPSPQGDVAVVGGVALELEEDGL
jgi:hypothetical protein